MVKLIPALAGAVLACLWLAFGWLLRRASRQIRRLDRVLAARPAPAPALPSRDLRPRLSVVVAARDEAEAIERTIRSLLAQRQVPLEIIAVDDRSTDATGAILDRLAAGETGDGPARLVVLHNRELPDGWLGKCHACHLGAARAVGDWILFMDGDVSLAPDDLLARILGLAEEDRIDHVAILPDSRPMSALQFSLMAVFGHLYLLAARAWEIDRDLTRGGAGVGAFNLVRRAAYERVGGYRLLRLDPADDYKLGRILKESGARQRIFDGVNRVRCPWHRGALAVIRGLEKNMFAGLNYSLVALLALTLQAAVTLLGPAVVAAAGLVAAVRGGGSPGLAILALTGIAAQILVVAWAFVDQTRRAGGSPLILALLYPVGVTLILFAAWNSAIRTLWRGGGPLARHVLPAEPSAAGIGPGRGRPPIRGFLERPGVRSQGTRTPAARNRPAFRRPRTRFASESGKASVSTRTPAAAASPRNSSPSRRVLAVTVRTTLSWNSRA